MILIEAPIPGENVIRQGIVSASGMKEFSNFLLLVGLLASNAAFATNVVGECTGCSSGPCAPGFTPRSDSLCTSTGGFKCCKQLVPTPITARVDATVCSEMVTAATIGSSYALCHSNSHCATGNCCGVFAKAKGVNETASGATMTCPTGFYPFTIDRSMYESICTGPSRSLKFTPLATSRFRVPDQLIVSWQYLGWEPSTPLEIILTSGRTILYHSTVNISDASHAIFLNRTMNTTARDPAIVRIRASYQFKGFYEEAKSDPITISYQPEIIPRPPSYALPAGKFVLLQWKARQVDPLDTAIQAALCSSDLKNCTSLYASVYDNRPVIEGNRFFEIPQSTPAGLYVIKFFGGAFQETTMAVKVAAVDGMSFNLHVPTTTFLMNHKYQITWSYNRTESEGRFNAVSVCIGKEANASCANTSYKTPSSVSFNTGFTEFLVNSTTWTPGNNYYAFYMLFYRFFGNFANGTIPNISVFYEIDGKNPTNQWRAGSLVDVSWHIRNLNKAHDAPVTFKICPNMDCNHAKVLYANTTAFLSSKKATLIIPDHVPHGNYSLVISAHGAQSWFSVPFKINNYKTIDQNPPKVTPSETAKSTVQNPPKATQPVPTQTPKDPGPPKVIEFNQPISVWYQKVLGLISWTSSGFTSLDTISIDICYGPKIPNCKAHGYFLVRVMAKVQDHHVTISPITVHMPVRDDYYVQLTTKDNERSIQITSDYVFKVHEKPQAPTFIPPINVPVPAQKPESTPTPNVYDNWSKPEYTPTTTKSAAKPTDAEIKPFSNQNAAALVKPASAILALFLVPLFM